MLFNSYEFPIFLLVVYCIYWSLNRKNQNILLLIASYIFYGWWDWRFLSLIIISSVVDFSIDKMLVKPKSRIPNKLLLILSLSVNLGILGFFKYFNFFAEGFIKILNTFGFNGTYSSLNIILPLGISFYTFQTLSYTIDVYRKRCDAHKDIIEFFIFVAFFPQLVAGPIERATNLLRQFSKDRVFDIDQTKDGLRQMLWGFF